VKALRLNDPVLLPATLEQNAAQPQPACDELLIRVHAAGVTPTELLWYPTTHIKSGEKRSRAIPGHEFSGAVAAMGSDGCSKGDAIRLTFSVTSVTLTPCRERHGLLRGDGCTTQ
jgi:NADPH:quinone reductase-like Zn-dependent oxidoreductase